MFGDSLVAGYSLTQDQAIPAMLEIYLRQKGYDVRVTNAGVSGDTTSAALQRVKKTVVTEPHLVIIVLGGNDMLRAVSPDVVHENLKQIILGFKDNNIKLMLVQMVAANNFGLEYKTKFDNIYPDLANKYNITLIPFLLLGVIDRPELMFYDGIHPNANGVLQVVANIGPIVENEVKELHK
jgi:acyl-CoA thioesterase-1